MLVFDKIITFSKEANALWIKTPLQALAFLSSLFLTFFIITLLWIFPPWSLLLRSLHASDKADGQFLVSKMIADSNDDGSFRVLALGGSTTRELTSHSGTIGQLLTQRCGTTVDFINGGTSNQSLLESWTFAEHLATKKLDVVVVGMNYYRLAFGIDDLIQKLPTTKLPFPVSRSLLFKVLPETQHLPKLEPFAQIGYLAAHKKYYNDIKKDKTAPKDIRPFHGVRNRYKKPVFTQLQKKERVSSMISYSSARYIRNARNSIGLWLDFIKFLQNKNIRPVFIILPMDSEMRRARPLFDPIMNESMQTFSNAGVKIIDWRDLPTLTQADFYDQQHLIASGRKKIRPLLLKELSHFIPHCDKQASDYK